MESNIQILSYGGGVQSVAMIVLCLQEKLPLPDKIIFADTSREKTSTFEYLNNIVTPALQEINKKVEIVGHNYAYNDLYSSNDKLLIPVYTPRGKFPTFCSSEWKERPLMRYIKNECGINACDVWLGFTIDEITRAKPGTRKWFNRVFPLINLGLSRQDCENIILEYGWPIPFKSSCWMCPNMANHEWVQLKTYYPEDFEKAKELERELQEFDNVTLHFSSKNIDDVQFDEDLKSLKIGHFECGSGYCFV